MSRKSYFFLFLSSILLLCTIPTQYAEGNSPSSALHVLPPLAQDFGDMRTFDQTLTNFLTVSVCMVTSNGECTIVKEFTSNSGTHGIDRIELRNDYYHVNWKTYKEDLSKEFEIHFTVAGLKLGVLKITPQKITMPKEVQTMLEHYIASIKSVILKIIPQIAIPIRFHIANHPLIRARVLHEQGFTATENAKLLREEFGLSAREVAQILSDEGYGVVAIGKALRDVFFLSPDETAQILKDIGYNSKKVCEVLKHAYGKTGREAAQILKEISYSCIMVGLALKDVYSKGALGAARILKDIGCSARETYKVLTRVYDLEDEIDIEQILASAGYNEEEYLGFTAFNTVKKFAPLLKFDREYKQLPMSAQEWFDEMLCGELGGPVCTDQVCDYTGCQRHDIPWGNEIDFSKLKNGEVPTYYKVVHCGTEGQLRIFYWWFYGHQYPCDYDGNSGEHAADWEHIMVTTSSDRSVVAAVTYFQHSGWYTRVRGPSSSNFEYAPDGVRPVVYVGKLAHGSYHDSCDSPVCKYSESDTPYECYYYGDFRNPAGKKHWWYTDRNLVDLDGDSEPWIEADRTAKWNWGYNSVDAHPTQDRAEYQCDLRACEVDMGGCEKSQCWSNWTECDLDWVIPACNCGLMDWEDQCAEQYEEWDRNSEWDCISLVTIDFNDLIPPDSGEEIIKAFDTNDAEQITSYGFKNEQRHSFLLTPAPTLKNVRIDIKPGSCPNNFRLPRDISELSGKLSVAVLGSKEFDVTTIDPTGIRMTREGVEGEVAPIRSAYEDVATPFEGETCGCHDLNGDGYMDMILKFMRKELADVLNLYDAAGQIIPLTISGNLKEEYEGVPIRGEDCVGIKIKK